MATARPGDRLLLPSLGTGEPKPLQRLSDPVSRRVPSGRGWGWGLLRNQATPLLPAIAWATRLSATVISALASRSALGIGTRLTSQFPGDGRPKRFALHRGGRRVDGLGAWCVASRILRLRAVPEPGSLRCPSEPFVAGRQQTARSRGVNQLARRATADAMSVYPVSWRQDRDGESVNVIPVPKTTSGLSPVHRGIALKRRVSC